MWFAYPRLKTLQHCKKNLNHKKIISNLCVDLCEKWVAIGGAQFVVYNKNRVASMLFHMCKR
jgi:hypothetical protein